MSKNNLKSNTPPDPATQPPPGICTDSSAFAGNLFQSIGNSLIDLTGLGTLFDSQTPLSKLQDEIQQIKDETQDVINNSTAIFASTQESIDEQMIAGISLVNSSLQSYIGWQDEIINGRIELNTIYIGGSFILILVTIFFLLISNAFNKK